jgi:hypothetical protein
VEDKEGSQSDAGEAEAVVPFEGIAKIGDGKNGKDRESDDFLNGFELGAGEFVRPDAIGRNLEAVFEEGDAPTGQNHLPERRIAIFQMTVPGEGHEDIGDGEKNDGAQGGLLKTYIMV